MARTMELVNSLETLVKIAERQLDQSATRQGLRNADAIAKARKALKEYWEEIG